MIPNGCPRCGKGIHWPSFTSMPDVSVTNLPWPTIWHPHVGNCSQCGARIYAYNCTNRDATAAWDMARAQLKFGTTLTSLFTTSKRDHTLPNVVYVYWHPMGLFPDANTQAEAALDAYLKANATPANRIILVPEGCDSTWAIKNKASFSEGYTVSSHVLNDGSGPYPSLKFGIALNRYLMTEFGDNRTPVVHLWPIPMVDATHCLPFAKSGTATPDDAMVILWRSYLRTNVTTEKDTTT